MTKTNYDLTRLRGRIHEKGYREGEFFELLGHNATYSTRIFNGAATLSADDIAAAADLLEIPAEEIGTFFFCRSVTETAQKEC